MKVCVLTGQRQLEWTEREIPQPAAGELQIKLEYVGICGSDLHFYDQGRLANWELDGPLALGHEPGGVVTAIGEGVTGFEVGDKVAIEPAVPCGKCEACRTGHYNLCPDVKMLAIPHERDGVFSEYCTHDATMCFKLPENMDTMEGGLLEPLTVGMHGTELSNAKIGETAIVLGCGCIGLCTIMSLKARGVTEIYAADVLDKRLEMALEVGATRVFNSTKESIEEFAKTLPGGGADQVYECAGNRITTLQTCRLIKRAGKVTLTGVSPEPVLELDIATLNAMEGTIYSVYRYRNLYPKAIKAGSVSNAISMNVDFAPTFLDFAGVEIPSDIQGASLKPILVNEGKTPADWRKAAYYHYYEYPAEHSVKRHYGIRTQDFKLIHFYNDIDEWEMYDMKADPREMNNVFGKPEYAEKQKELMQLLKETQKQYKDTDPDEKEKVLFKGDRRLMKNR